MTVPKIKTEIMSGAFTKYHLKGPWPFHPVIHRFTEPDHGDYHDHPFRFRSMILHGGYIEEVLDIPTGDIWTTKRLPGDSFMIGADHVHRIIELLDGECFTIILPHAWEQKSGFYQVRDDGIYHRYWDQAEFAPIISRNTNN